MPVVLEFILLDFELLAEQIPCVLRVVDEDIIHAQELRLVVLDDAGVRCDRGLAVRERVQCIDGLVRGNIIRKMDDKVRLCGGHVFDLLDLDFSLVLRLQDGIHEDMSRLSVRYLLDGQCVLVDLLDFCPYLDAAPALSLHVFGTVGESSCRKVRKQLERLAFEICYGCVYQFIEIMRKDLGCHTDGDSFRALCEQQRETYRELYRFLVSSVV